MIKKRLVKKGLSLGLVFVMCMGTALSAHAQNSQEMNNDVEINIADEQDSMADEADFEEVERDEDTMLRKKTRMRWRKLKTKKKLPKHLWKTKLLWKCMTRL